MNFFSPESTAQRYAQGRPDFHPHTIEKVRQYLNLTDKLEKVLDVGCGTGLSTKALLEIGKQVFGTDSSQEMLKHAACKDQIQYQSASATSQPYLDGEFDLLTVCSAIHWFDIDQFLGEANRLLKPRAHLVLYDNFFISEMVSVPSFSNWFPETYLRKFPSPPRNNGYQWSRKNLSPLGFSLVEEDTFKNGVDFSMEELVLYFTTQSNITAAISSGAFSYIEIESWLRKDLVQFFPEPSQKRTLLFGNWIKYLQKNAS